ncbi:MAG TPA: COX15/CtaA family protein [Longimicrobiales bacterium]
MNPATARAPAMAPGRTDWRLEVPESRRRVIRAWLWSIAAMTAAVLVVGGITRLTLSGLSIVDWDPLMGVIPPLTDAQWQERFAQYQQFPDYSWRDGMTLAQFRFIYFWEYLHRLLARLIGLVFLIPFVLFQVRGWFTRSVRRRALALFGLGAMQGVMGWLMVMSGLVDRPSVSHYRLAAHLSLAFLIFGYAVWLARELRIDAARAHATAPVRRMIVRGLALFGSVLAVQIVWGAFVAGLRAGKYYPTFPLMGGRLVPPDLLTLDPLTRNFIENPVAVQWLHRVIGTVLLIVTVAFFARAFRAPLDPLSRRFAVALLGLTAVQYLLGVLTIVHLVPVGLGVTHQFAALLLFGVWLAWLHHARNLRPTEVMA